MEAHPHDSFEDMALDAAMGMLAAMQVTGISEDFANYTSTLRTGLNILQTGNDVDTIQWHEDSDISAQREAATLEALDTDMEGVLILLDQVIEHKYERFLHNN